MKKLMFLFAAILVLSSCKTSTAAKDKKEILAIMYAGILKIGFIKILR
tara:strand:- start:852 stop:995 length:144 start_codon:yes stop_codon:yes gene_type:complete